MPEPQGKVLALMDGTAEQCQWCFIPILFSFIIGAEISHEYKSGGVGREERCSPRRALLDQAASERKHSCLPFITAIDFCIKVVLNQTPTKDPPTLQHWSARCL